MIYYLGLHLEQILESIFPNKFIKSIVFFLFFWLGCQDADYSLDNVSDPFNLDLAPPAIFFHPQNIADVGVGDTFSVKLYTYDLPEVAGAQMQVLYDRGSLAVDSVSADTFFLIESMPLLFPDSSDVDGELDVFIFSLPTESKQNVSGTDAMARIYFSVKSPGISELRYNPSETRFVNFQNENILIKSYGKSFVDAQ